jgi:hypothetical protein
MGNRLVRVVLAVVLAGCGSSSGGSTPDAQVAEAGAPEVSAALPYCTAKPALPSVTDLSGLWVARVTGSQIVNAPIVGAVPNQNVFYLLVTISQTGAAVVVNGRYCDRTQINAPTAIVPVVIPDAWAHTEKGVYRTGTFATGADGYAILDLPAVTETSGAVLNPPDAPLPATADDPNVISVIDEDNDGHPGITVRLSGQSFAGSLYTVQQQVTAIKAIAVAPDRLEGTLAFTSKQIVLASDPATIAVLYSQSTTSPDFVTCNSGVSMVKVGQAPALDGGSVDASAIDAGAIDAGGAITCAWVRANETSLFP